MTMNKKVLCTAILSLLFIPLHAQHRDDASLRKLQIAEMAINSLYVDSVDEQKLVEDGIRGMLEKLDPHSSYLTAKEVKEANEPLQGNFEGIGVQFNMVEDTLLVIQPVTGGPSEKVGIVAGDRIVSVNDTAIAGVKMSKEEIMRRLRGPKGTKVVVGILRSGEKDILRYTITRGDIPVHSVDAKFIIESKGQKIGFVRVNKFGESTYAEFIRALAELKAEGATSYIVDLRENSGGYMEQAIRMANEFLSTGDLIVYSKGRAYPKSEGRANGAGRFKNVPLVVLIDNFSASASEIFAGAMQDNDRATIIGRRSFGKGLVQQQIPFSDGSAVRLTVARYYTPSGRCIQKPYTLGEKDDYDKDLLERYEHGEMFSADSIHMTDTTVYFTKKGRIVRGGGGIMPDIFVGRDTSLNTPWYNRCANLAYTYQFAYQYTDRHRKELSQFKDWKALEKHLLAANWVPEFVAFCEKKGVEPNQAQIKQSKPLLIRIVNAYIVRDVLGDEGFFPLFERDDDITKKAIEFLSK